MEDQGQSASKRVIVIGVVSLLFVFVLLAYFGVQQEEAAPVPPSTEWTTAPEGGVEVELPESPMRNMPAETADDDAVDTSADQTG